MATENVFVTSDTTDLVKAPKSTADAILANVTTTVHLKAGQPAAPALEMGDYIECDLHAEGKQTARVQLVTIASLEEGKRLLADPSSGWKKAAADPASQAPATAAKE